MKVIDTLAAYRFIMVFLHLFFTSWILDVFGFKVRTFLFLTKINFFSNFYYFVYTSKILKYVLKNFRTNVISEKIEKKSHREEKEATSNTIYKFCFCLSVAVVTLYWSINFLAPTLLGTTQIPLILDLFLHGGNLLVLFLDSLLDGKTDKRNHNLKTSFLFKFSVCYVFIQYLVYYTLSVEIYPMISKLSVPKFSMIGVAGYGLFMFGHLIYEKVLVGR
jgi:hypothetical protein